MPPDPNELLSNAKEELSAASSEQQAEAVRIHYLGKKGELTAILRSMSELGHDERKELGAKANSVRDEITRLIEDKKEEFAIRARAEIMISEALDVTETRAEIEVGARHLITQTIDEICSIFADMGYSITEGPEAETVFYNFDALNAAPSHPSRDLTDTFYLSEDTLLRTQTSPVQVRTLLAGSPPVKVISPGRCFRVDPPDATHSPMFHQVEGLLVDEGVTMADLKGTLDAFAKRMFGEDVQTKFRPHFFPFTEPSAEMDMSCIYCGGKGCRICKGGGWIEVLGCGMVHPNVLKVGNIGTERFTGFAFGMGVERMAMLKHSVEDMRLFFENDIRFLRQFA